MSTKAHIIYNNDFEFYHETSEHQSIFGKFQGWNIYFIAEKRAVERFAIVDDFFYVQLNHNGEKVNLKFWGGDILKVDFDIDGLLIIIKGGTRTAKLIEEKDLNAFDFYEIPEV